jgi:hypothetical protein
MRLLLDGRAGDYLRAAAIGADPCIFVHVPKTAGTSLRTELASLLRPEANIVVDYRDTSRSFHARMDEAVERFLAAAGPSGIRFASGHILARHVARMRAFFGDARFVTFLRNPVDRVVSDYRHQRSPRHPVHAAFAARFPTLEDYVAFAPEQNKMAQHLVPEDVFGGARPRECIAHVMEAYAFVGIQEMYDLSFRTLTALAGGAARPSLRANVAEGDPEERRVTTAMAHRIRQANRLDLALYDHFHGLLAGAAPGLEAALGAA